MCGFKTATFFPCRTVDTWITNTKFVMSDEAYDTHLKVLIDSSTPLNASMVLKECLRSRTSQLVPSSPSPLFASAVISGAVSQTTTKTNGNYALYYEESKETTPQLQRFLRRLRRCFGLYYSSGNDGAKKSLADKAVSKDDSPSTTSSKDGRLWTERGVYKGVLRFSYGGQQMFLVGSRSPFHFERRKVPEAPEAASEAQTMR